MEALLQAFQEQELHRQEALGQAFQTSLACQLQQEQPRLVWAEKQELRRPLL